MVNFIGGRNRREKHRPAASHWQTLSHNVVSHAPRPEWARNNNISGDRHWLHLKQCNARLSFNFILVCTFIFCETFISFFFAFHFQLLGLGIFIPGLLMVLNVDVINDKVLPVMQQVSVGVFNLGDLAKGLSITLMIFGSFVIIVSSLGACGACCQNRLCLGLVSII